MDHKQKTALAAAIAAGLGGITVADDAAAFATSATLTQILSYSDNGTAALNISSSTGLWAWSYDDVTGLMAQKYGLLIARAATTPTEPYSSLVSTLFRQSITGLVIGGGGAASATSFVCTEGDFGGKFGVNICGNYTLGGNFFDESTTNWGPGTAVARTLGGDDLASGPQQSIAILNGMSTVSWAGATLILSNRTCTGPCTTLPSGNYNNGYQYTFNAPQVLPVPIPAAVWLFGSALGAMGLMRRKPAT